MVETMAVRKDTETVASTAVVTVGLKEKVKVEWTAEWSVETMVEWKGFWLVDS
jgi:hypothetical protein